MSIISILPNIIELSGLLIVWSKFEEEIPNKFIKNLLVIAVTIGLGLVTSELKPLSILVINNAFLILTLTLVYQLNFLDCIIKLVISYAIALSIEFVIFLGLTFTFTNNVDVQNPEIKILGSIAFIIVLGILYRNKRFNRFFRAINDYLDEINFQFKNLWVVNTVVYSLVIKIIWDMAPSFILHYKYFILILFFLIYVLNIYIYKNDVLSYEKSKMEQYYNQYSPVMTNIVEDVRSKQHEFKNHINAIYGIIQVAEEESIRDELNRYILSLNKSLEKVDFVRSENNIINAIVYGKIVEARKYDIEFNYGVKDVKRLPVEDFEMSEILSNLLNNAFEAVEAEEDNDNKIDLDIHIEGGYLTINVKNSGDTLKVKDTDKLFKKGFSTKNRGSGYGLFNVQQIVKEAGGTIRVDIEDGYTVFEVKLPAVKGIQSIMD